MSVIHLVRIPSIVFCLAFLTNCTPLKFSDSPNGYQPTLPQLDKIKIALVLGGGGAKGMAHVGVIEELHNAGIRPDLIVGCSAGAIVGGLYADNPDPVSLKNALMEKKREHLINLSLQYLPFGLSNGVAMKEFLEDRLVAKSYAELKIPFIAVATNLQFGDLVAFGSGPLEPTIRASAAFPGVFTPVSIGGQYFVDGGVANNVPVEVARRMGAEYIIAVELDGGLVDKPPKHVIGILKRCLEISLRQQSRIATKDADFVIRVPLDGIGTFDDGINPQVYMQGKNVAKQIVGLLISRLKERS